MNQVIGLLSDLLNRNVSAKISLDDSNITDWSIWTQDGPSDDTMLVSFDAEIGILWDDLLGYSYFPLPLRCLDQCVWHKVGDL